MPVDYSKAKIYQIVCNITGETYYGSTTQPLKKRMYGHRNTNDTTSRGIIKRGDYYSKIIEYCPCESKNELEGIEYEYIDFNKCVNSQQQRPYRDRMRLNHTKWAILYLGLRFK
jgi:predicted GIY-YIG superfamily endonuclease